MISTITIKKHILYFALSWIIIHVNPRLNILKFLIVFVELMKLIELSQSRNPTFGCYKGSLKMVTFSIHQDLSLKVGETVLSDKNKRTDRLVKEVAASSWLFNPAKARSVLFESPWRSALWNYLVTGKIF